MFEKIREIICQKLNVSPDKITMDTSFVDDLEADSLDIVELVMCIEDEFDIIIEDEQAEKIKTVGDTVKYLEKYLNV